MITVHNDYFISIITLPQGDFAIRIHSSIDRRDYSFCGRIPIALLPIILSPIIRLAFWITSRPVELLPSQRLLVHQDNDFFTTRGFPNTNSLSQLMYPRLSD
jgi:hypothetical protein